jgi:hypothetical protein
MYRIQGKQPGRDLKQDAGGFGVPLIATNAKPAVLANPTSAGGREAKE